MQSGGKTFFERRTSDELDTFFVQLDLGDKSAKITATFTQKDHSVEAPVSCVRSVSARVRGYRHLGVIDRCDRPSYRPRVIIIACGDGNYGLTRLHWRHWNRRKTKAHAAAYANDCVPYCAAGNFHRYPVRVRAYRVRRLGGTYAYTRLRIAYVNARPASSPRVIVERARAKGGQYFWR